MTDFTDSTTPRLAPEVFARYLAGETSPAEDAEIQAWLRAHPVAPHMVAELRAPAVSTPPRLDMAARWAQVKRDMARDMAPDRSRPTGTLGMRGVPASQTPSRPHDRRRRILSLTVGALATLALVMGGMRWLSNAGPVGIVAGATYHTADGQRAVVTLRDGSRVTLAPNSELVVDQRFATETRSVALRGEAHFDVAQAAGAPFVVQTGAVTTRVLGTAFVVRHYTDDPSVRIAVLTGKVATAGARTPTVLTAGAVAYVTDSTTRIASDASAEAFAAWLDGRLVFRDMPVPDVLRTVGHWYGYRFTIADSTLAARHVTATFTTDALDRTLYELGRLLNATLSVRDSAIIVRAHRGVPYDTARNTRRLEDIDRRQPVRSPGFDLRSPSKEVGK